MRPPHPQQQGPPYDRNQGPPARRFAPGQQVCRVAICHHIWCSRHIPFLHKCCLLKGACIWSHHVLHTFCELKSSTICVAHIPFEVNRMLSSEGCMHMTRPCLNKCVARRGPGRRQGRAGSRWAGVGSRVGSLGRQPPPAALRTRTRTLWPPPWAGLGCEAIQHIAKSHDHTPIISALRTGPPTPMQSVGMMRVWRTKTSGISTFLRMTWCCCCVKCRLAIILLVRQIRHC